MSEPDSAFLKLKIDRADLITWLEDRPRLASGWTDWRSIGGQYYFKGGPRDIADVPDAELTKHLADCDAELRGFESNRAALRKLLGSGDEPFLTRIVYDAPRRELIAGSLSYSDNLDDYIVFLTVARGAATRFRADGYGVVVIHNYLWGRPNERITKTAMRLGPGERSEFMAASELASAAGAFQPIADEVLTGPFPPPTHNELETLK